MGAVDRGHDGLSLPGLVRGVFAALAASSCIKVDPRTPLLEPALAERGERKRTWSRRVDAKIRQGRQRRAALPPPRPPLFDVAIDTERACSWADSAGTV